MSSISPPQNNTQWIWFASALQIVYNPREGIAERKENNEGFFRIAEKFKRCLDTLEAGMDSPEKALPYEDILKDSYSISGSYGVSYAGVNGNITHFSEERGINYFSLIRDLRDIISKILNGVEPSPEKGEVFEKFADYVGHCRR